MPWNSKCLNCRSKSAGSQSCFDQASATSAASQTKNTAQNPQSRHSRKLRTSQTWERGLKKTWPRGVKVWRRPSTCRTELATVRAWVASPREVIVFFGPRKALFIPMWKTRSNLDFADCCLTTTVFCWFRCCPRIILDPFAFCLSQIHMFRVLSCRNIQLRWALGRLPHNPFKEFCTHGQFKF